MKIDIFFTSNDSKISGFNVCKKSTEKDLGLKYVPPHFTRSHYFQVEDEQLFFFAVLKYGIVFKEIKL